MSIALDPRERERVFQPPAAPLASHLPIIGGTLEYVDSPLATMFRRYRQHGPVSDLHILGQTWTAMLGPDACQIALRIRTRRSRTALAGATWSVRSSTAG